MKLCTAEIDRLTGLYNNASEPEFSVLVDSWVEVIKRHAINKEIALDALKTACYFADSMRVWKDRRRLNAIK